jgi:isopentenyldiphosphate isomerase
MADIFNLLENGVLVEKREIVEGLNPTNDFIEYISRFFPEEVYNLNKNSLLYKLLYSILGDAGVLGVKKASLAPKLYTSLMGTNFDNIDSLFQNLLQLPRVNSEIYSFDPHNELLTEEQWSAVRYKDSDYKNRAQEYMRYFQYGNSHEGIETLAKAAFGGECSIQERWKYLDDIVSDEPIGVQNLGVTNSYQEIIVLPETISLSIREQRRINMLLSRLSPMNSTISINTSNNKLTEVTFDKTNMNSTSNYFYVNRLVTGNSRLDYSYTSKNNWIEAGVEKSAPYAAFNGKSEVSNAVPVYSITSSSYHTGSFNIDQRKLFEHLNLVDDVQMFSYVPTEALAQSLENNLFSSPWVVTTSTDKTNYFINSGYPVGYFADKNYSPPIGNSLYWASEEKAPTELDSLEIDLLNEKAINSVEFEISQKPIDVKIYYWGINAETSAYDWIEVNYRTDIETNLSVYYRASKSYTWQYMNPYFDTVQTNKLKIEFQRRNDVFPYLNYPAFNWSVEVRNLRLIHAIANISDFVASTGVDSLGNSYRTTAKEYSLENLFNNKKVRFWKSQVNPTRFAVEAIYFDISNEGAASLIDEIYLDPLTPGCLVHIYYTDDESTTDWDNKLWTPTNRHYTLAKGYIKLPQTISAKYIKIEFTNLSVTPYDFSDTKNKVQYRLYPTWVENQLNQFGSLNTNDPLTTPESFSSTDPSFINLGIVKPGVDKLTPEIPVSIIDYIDSNIKSTVLDEYQVWKNPDLASNDSPILDKVINFYPNEQANLYQNNIINTTSDQNLSIAFNYLNSSSDPVNWTSENPILQKTLFNLSTRTDRSSIVEEKTWPDMWFTKKCRHGYKVIESPRSDKVGYYAGIKDVKFYKRDQTLAFDDFNYVISLSDDSTSEINNLVFSNWSWQLTPQILLECGTNNVVEFASDNFDGIGF